ncbi:MAG TPA: YfiR family protein [Verrucomicrobiae bacterium]|jgi:hypothetical protein
MIKLLMALSPEIEMMRAFVLTIAILSVAIGLPNVAVAEAHKEYEVKAGMLFNLTHFVEWPPEAFEDAASPIVIGVLGRDPFGHYLEKAIQGETVNGRRIVIKHFARPQTLARCHILFICADEKPKLDQIFPRLKGRPIFTVSEIERFSSLQGGMLLIHENNQKKIRLRLNLKSARAAGLNVSSKLIQVAELEKTSLLVSPHPQARKISFSAHKPSFFGAGHLE